MIGEVRMCQGLSREEEFEVVIRVVGFGIIFIFILFIIILFII